MRQSTLRFQGVEGELRALRLALGDLLGTAGWTTEEMGDVLLIASELATNVVMHARTPYEVRCTVDDHVELQVIDGASDVFPYVRRAGDGPGGMGMRIVDDLARYWTVERRGRRKAVTAVIDRPLRTGTP